MANERLTATVATAGLVLAVAVLPAVDHLQDTMTAHAGFDDR